MLKKDLRVSTLCKSNHTVGSYETLKFKKKSINPETEENPFKNQRTNMLNAKTLKLL